MIEDIAKLMIATSVADGELHDDETGVTIEVLLGFGLGIEEITPLIGSVVKDMQTEGWIQSTVDNLNTMGDEIKHMTLGCMILMAKADGVIDLREIELITAVADAFGIDVFGEDKD